MVTSCEWLPRVEHTSCTDLWNSVGVKGNSYLIVLITVYTMSVHSFTTIGALIIQWYLKWTQTNSRCSQVLQVHFKGSEITHYDRTSCGFHLIIHSYILVIIKSYTSIKPLCVFAHLGCIVMMLLFDLLNVRVVLNNWARHSTNSGS